MKERKIKLNKFKELEPEVMRVILDKTLDEKLNLKQTIEEVLKEKYRLEGFVTTKLELNLEPFYFEGQFTQGLFEYMIVRENDSTKFYSNKNVKENKYLVSLRNESDNFIKSYLVIYKEAKELLFLLRNSFEEYYFDQLISYDKEIYLKNGTVILSDCEGD